MRYPFISRPAAADRIRSTEFPHRVLKSQLGLSWSHNRPAVFSWIILVPSFRLNQF